MSDSTPADRPQTVVVGVTGAACAGKSAVAALMAEEGFEVVDVDAVGHEVLERADVKDRLRQAFGDGIFDEQDRVHRAALSAIVFASREALERLNSIVHPPMRAEVEQRIARAEAPVALDAALLIEMGLMEAHCDFVIFVDAPDAERKARAERLHHWSAEELARRDASQLPSDVKRRRANLIIENRGSQDDLRRAVQSAVKRIWKEVSRSPHQAARP